MRSLFFDGGWEKLEQTAPSCERTEKNDLLRERGRISLSLGKGRGVIFEEKGGKRSSCPDEEKKVGERR